MTIAFLLRNTLLARRRRAGGARAGMSRCGEGCRARRAARARGRGAAWSSRCCCRGTKARVGHARRVGHVRAGRSCCCSLAAARRDCAVRQHARRAQRRACRSSAGVWSVPLGVAGLIAAVVRVLERPDARDRPVRRRRGWRSPARSRSSRARGTRCATNTARCTRRRRPSRARGRSDERQLSRLRGADRLVAVAALALMLFMFVFSWFGESLSGTLPGSDVSGLAAARPAGKSSPSQPLGVAADDSRRARLGGRAIAGGLAAAGVAQPWPRCDRAAARGGVFALLIALPHPPSPGRERRASAAFMPPSASELGIWLGLAAASRSPPAAICSCAKKCPRSRSPSSRRRRRSQG